jgi:SAM-dependent methyltransferase
LRAFRRLLRVAPDAKMILVGEPHPEFPLHSLIRTLGITAAVRVMGFTPIDDFTGFIAACDIVLNLRYPTVGESSGSLLRALGLGKAVLVSGVGAFREFPDDVCLKVPVGAGEEDLIFEYLNLLVSRPEVAHALGHRAAGYVKEECNWDRVACLYAAFLKSIMEGSQWEAQSPATSHPPPGTGAQPPTPVPPECISIWAANDESAGYLETHLTRLVKTLEITPPGGPDDRILEMGAYLQITPALRSKLGYGCVRGCYYGPAGTVEHRSVVSSEGKAFSCEVDLFNAEKDVFPYPDGHFSTVLCCELIEHLSEDPMHMMSEINRILKPGGHLVLTTPNIGSLRGIAAMLEGFHPGIFTAYIRPRDGEVEARHNREYAPREIEQLMRNSGFTVTLLETGPFRETPHPEEGWVRSLLERFNLPQDWRGEDIYVVGRKTGAVRERYPNWLYA